MLLLINMIIHYYKAIMAKLSLYICYNHMIVYNHMIIINLCRLKIWILFTFLIHVIN